MLRRHAALLAAALGALAATATLVTACGGAERTFQHESFFVVTGTHAAYACEKCHDPAAPSFSVAAKGVDCLTSQCHTKPICDASHGAVSGYAYDCATCIQCHKDGKTGGLPANHPFPVAAGTAHAGISCSLCHGASRAKADLLCNTCHGGVAALAIAHSGMTGYTSASPACYDCHPQGTANVNHAALTRFPIDHRGARTCAQCHGATRAKADLDCYTAGCHTPSRVTSQHGTPRPNSGACYDCHPDGRSGD